MGERVQLTERVHYLRGGSNVGLIVQGSQALVVDAGLDRSSAKEIGKALDDLGIQAHAIVITHAHADHFGGAFDLAKRTGAPVYAMPLEGAIVSQPLLEPLFLYGGACPIAELTHKFTLARACPVAFPLSEGSMQIGPFSVEIRPLYGHAPQQIGLRYQDVLFTADAFFPIETLEKHGIPFCADLDGMLSSLDSVTAEPAEWYIPGHGAAVQRPAEILATNRERLLGIRAMCLEVLDAPREASVLLAHVASRLEVSLADPVSYYLAQATVLAALASCQRAGLAAPVLEGNRLFWRSVQDRYTIDS